MLTAPSLSRNFPGDVQHSSKMTYVPNCHGVSNMLGVNWHSHSQDALGQLRGPTHQF